MQATSFSPPISLNRFVNVRGVAGKNIPQLAKGRPDLTVKWSTTQWSYLELLSPWSPLSYPPDIELALMLEVLQTFES